MEGDREEEHSGFHSHRVEEVPKVVVLFAAAAEELDTN